MDIFIRDIDGLVLLSGAITTSDEDPVWFIANNAEGKTANGARGTVSVVEGVTLPGDFELGVSTYVNAAFAKKLLSKKDKKEILELLELVGIGDEVSAADAITQLGVSGRVQDATLVGFFTAAKVQGADLKDMAPLWSFEFYLKTLDIALSGGDLEAAETLIGMVPGGLKQNVKDALVAALDTMSIPLLEAARRSGEIQVPNPLTEAHITEARMLE
jgi:hypothetical protein